MSLHIIIDGYNFIRQSSFFSRIDADDIQEGRVALIDLMFQYRKIKKHRITIVFDGTNAPSYLPRKQKTQGINVYFSRQGELADSLIKSMADKEGNRALIVSSDNDIINYAALRGAATISSTEFEEKIIFSISMDLKGLEPADYDEPEEIDRRLDTRKKGPKRRLSKKDRRSRKKIKLI